jgi:LacI family transcriptional regulator
MAVTRADVARRAGTSPALVSYVLNGGPRKVAPATEARILQAIEELGYRPNAVARSLRMARGHSLGLILPDSSNPYFALLARAVEEVAYRSGYPLLVGNAADSAEREIGYLHAFVDRQVEGLLVIPTAEDEVLETEFAKVGVPLVVLDRSLDQSVFANVVAASVEGSRDVVRHLIEHGHTRIACLSGPEVSTSEERVAGFRQAMESAGLEPGRVLSRPFGGSAGYGALPALMEGPEPPTALFVTSDLAAMGLLRAAFDMGLDVPQDLAVVSFDGIEYAAYTRPGLTTVSQPITQMAEVATQLLMDALGGGSIPPGTRALPTALVRRGSCGCADDFTGANAPA